MSGRWMWRCRPPRRGSWGPLAPLRPRGCRCGASPAGRLRLGSSWCIRDIEPVAHASSNGPPVVPFQPAGDCLNIWGSWACTVPQEMVIRVDKIFGGRSKEKRKMKVGVPREAPDPCKGCWSWGSVHLCLLLPSVVFHPSAHHHHGPPNLGRRGAAADRGAGG